MIAMHTGQLQQSFLLSIRPQHDSTFLPSFSSTVNLHFRRIIAVTHVCIKYVCPLLAAGFACNISGCIQWLL